VVRYIGIRGPNMNKGLIALILATGCSTGKVGGEGTNNAGDTGTIDTGVEEITEPLTSYICSAEEGNLEAVRTLETSPDENFYKQSVYIGSSADGIEAPVVYCHLEAIEGDTITHAELSFSSTETKNSSYTGKPNALSLEAYVTTVEDGPETVTYNTVADGLEDERLDYVTIYVDDSTPEEDRIFDIDVTAGMNPGAMSVIALVPKETVTVDPTSLEYQADAIIDDMQITFELDGGK
jgi:hypothetical protein